jgi:TorA maturation chaperone TorD
VYRGLAKLFAPSCPEALCDLRSGEWPGLEAALERLGAGAPVRSAARAVGETLERTGPAGLRASYEATFEASGGLLCAPNEMSHVADTPQEGLTRTFEMADVAGFYRAFGVEVAPGGERPDHVAAELEFMHLLAVKEAIARDRPDASEQAEVCRDAARTFLRDHLGRFSDRLAERLEASATDPLWTGAGRLLAGFVARDAEHLQAS